MLGFEVCPLVTLFRRFSLQLRENIYIIFNKKIWDTQGLYLSFLLGEVKSLS